MLTQMCGRDILWFSGAHATMLEQDILVRERSFSVGTCENVPEISSEGKK